MINMPGGPEVMVIILVALIVLGPEQLPKAMRTFGTVMAEIRKVSSGFQSEIKNAMDSFTEETDKAARGAEETKPQSATMTDAPGSEPAESTVDEVVVRNETSPTSGSAEVTTEQGPGTTVTRTVDETTELPPVDPIDRAAG